MAVHPPDAVRSGGKNDHRRNVALHAAVLIPRVFYSRDQLNNLPS